MASLFTPEVRRRRVFYIPGYDPIHPRRYRELYRKEGAAQAAISGYALALAPKHAGGPFGWHASTTIAGNTSEADFEVLVWSDIVAGSMGQSIPATYLQLLRTTWTYIASGSLWRLMQLRKGPMIAALYPIFALLAQLAAALAVGLLVGWVVALLLPSGVIANLLWLGIAALIGALILIRFRKLDGRFFAYYLMHDYAHTAQFAGAYPPDLEARLTDFGTRIAAALQDDWDEVLVVGHSSGAHLAVSILADLIRAGKVAQDGPALALLTLGQVVPMVSFLPRAQRLRADLAYLSSRDELTWVDVTAPGDGCAFALCDPVSVTGVAPPTKRWPLVLSAAFTKTLSPERWKELRWRFFRLHFQYLSAFDRPGDYDYFQITAGPQTLQTRFAGREPSGSRIERAVNRYVDIT